MKIGAFGLREFLDAIRWGRERIGIDIDGHSIRIARLDHGLNGGFRVVSYGELDIDLLHASSVEKQRFKLSLKQLGAGIERVALNVEHPSLRVRRMVFPKMPERDILEAIRWNFREHIEGPIDKYVVGFTPLEEGAEEGRLALMAYGLASEAVDEYTKLLRSLGLKPISLEPSASAILASFNANKVLADGRRHVCITFGDAMTLFSVMKGHSLLFCRPLPGGSNDALARLVMRNLNLDPDKTKKSIQSWMAGVQDTPGSEDGTMRRLQTTVGHFFSQLMVEIQRSIDAFCIMYGVDRVDVIHVCGMGVFYPGLVDHLRRTLGVETDIYNPFSRLMEPQRQTPDVVKVAPLYAVAVGLAIP
ncbi:MAG: pilus assembly protein PilM [bacterium]